VSKQTIPVPDIGTTEAVEVIEISVAVGDTVKAEDTLIVLESDKASMEVPSPAAGKVLEIKLKVGDKITQGTPMIVLESVGGAEPANTEAPAAKETKAEPEAKTEPAAKPAAPSAPAKQPSGGIELINVPDIGGAENVDVIEVNVKVGDTVAEGDTMIVLESDKASMEVPAPKAGTVRALKIKEGAKVSMGSPILELETSGGAETTPAPAPAPAPQKAAAAKTTAPAPVTTTAPPAVRETQPDTNGDIYAGPAVRKLAREMGIELLKVPGTGPKGRIQKDDLKNFVKNLIEKRGTTAAIGAAGGGIPAIPEIDFAEFGPVDIQPLSKLHKITATNMHRSWLNVPHVTQFDDADITDLEDFRTALKAEGEKRGVKITPLPFLLKACALALKAHPKFNASLHSDGERMVFKQYVHIGMAVDTPAGLVVPVMRDVDRKSIWDIAAEMAALAQKAKDRKLKLDDMQGGCFTISSLGNIGGLGFTPIVNTPEVAILGVSKLTVKPVWNGTEFVPRKMLPLSLSYDHRAVNGADAGRFFTYLNELLADIRRLAL